MVREIKYVEDHTLPDNRNSSNGDDCSASSSQQDSQRWNNPTVLQRPSWLWSVLGDNSPWITNVSTYLVNRSTECLCSGIIFGDVCIANSLGQRECLTLKERAELTYKI